MATQGTATIDFGAAPGNTNASVAVSSPAITGTQLTSAWIAPADTADHNVEEHVVEEIEVYAGPAQAGVGFTIYAVCRVGRAYGQFNIGWVYN